jgi:DNA-binding transcriptional regulator YdaS (Cro superfamily)
MEADAEAGQAEDAPTVEQGTEGEVSQEELPPEIGPRR